MHPPKVDPDRAASSAIELYDQDHDGVLSTRELAACPAILNRIDQYDTDRDSGVNAVEIANRLRPWYTGNIGMITLRCGLTLDGRPLRGAEIKLIPEPFLEPAVRSAHSIAEENAIYILRIAPEDLPRDQRGLDGVHVGLYKAQVTHPTMDLPPMFNSQTSVGVEITARDQVGGIEIRLESP